MSLPLISIISPTYNHEKYIGKCIESVLQQDFSEWEMIILDDGSTDNTYAVALGYAEKDSRIRVLTQQNVGVFNLAETYNKGLSISTGKYIAVLEGDDLWNRDKLSKQFKLMENDPSIVLAWGKAMLVNENDTDVYYSSPQVDNMPLEHFNNIPAGSIIEIRTRDAWIPALTMLIRKDALVKIGGFIQTHNMPLVDVPTILYLSLLGRFHFENHVLGKWRIYPTQTTKKYTVEIYTGLNEFVKEFLPKIYSPSHPRFAAIIDYFEQLCLISYARSGRYNLVRKNYSVARKDYLKAISHVAKGKMTWRLRAAVGFMMSLLHLDVEWMARLLGRKTYKR